MSTIKVCDWPKCGDVVSEHPDTLAMRFESTAVAAMADGLKRGELVHVERDPESLRKDLCRRHSVYLRARLEELFAGQYGMIAIALDAETIDDYDQRP